MNTNTVVIGGIVVLLAVGGLIFYTSQNAGPSTSATSTPSTNTGDTGVIPPAPQAGAPSVATDRAVSPSNSTAVVTGIVTPNGAQSTYWYEYGESTTLGGKTAAQGIGSGWVAIPSPGYITGLRANTTYYFRLSGQNAFGTVGGTTYSFSTNNNPPAQGTPPAAASNAAEDVERTSATLNARVNPHASQTTYWFEYGTDVNFGSVTAFQASGSGNASIAVSASVSGLNPLTKYYFRINAQNQFGTENGTTQNFTTKGPAAATQPSVTTRRAEGVGTSTATLRGTIDPNGFETTYWFEYSTDSLLGSLLLKTTPRTSAGSGTSGQSVEADITSLNSNTTYHFRLVAQNSAGIVRGDRESFKTK